VWRGVNREIGGLRQTLEWFLESSLWDSRCEIDDSDEAEDTLREVLFLYLGAVISLLWPVLCRKLVDWRKKETPFILVPV